MSRWVELVDGHKRTYVDLYSNPQPGDRPMTEDQVTDFCKLLRRKARAARESGELFARDPAEWRGRVAALSAGGPHTLETAAALVIALLMSEAPTS